MKLTKITELVPKGEHFDESAVNEGVWMSEAHLNSVESGLVASANSLATANAALEAGKTTIATANTALEAATAEIATLKTEATATAVANQTQAARIVELEAQVTELGKKPSGNGTPVNTGQDENAEDAHVPAYADANSSINAWFDKQTQYLEKPKA